MHKHFNVLIDLKAISPVTPITSFVFSTCHYRINCNMTLVGHLKIIMVNCFYRNAKNVSSNFDGGFFLSLDSTVIWWMAVSWTITPHLLFFYHEQCNKS